MTGRYYGDGSKFPWHPPAAVLRAHRAHLRAENMKKTEKIIRQSKYFTMIKSVHRNQYGRGACFQNHKVTGYKITPNFDPFWSPMCNEITTFLNVDHVREHDFGRTVWNFHTPDAADKAWVLLELKYG